jgi:hypothetical protein
MMQFNAAVADKDKDTASAIVKAIEAAVESIPYMANRTNITVFDSIEECKENMSDKLTPTGPSFNVLFANTDSLADYVAPMNKLGPFTPIIKVSAELHFDLMFQKQIPSDFMTFPLDPFLISRVLRSCCAMNTLSPEYISVMKDIPTIDPKMPLVEDPNVKPKRSYRKSNEKDRVKKKKTASASKKCMTAMKKPIKAKAKVKAPSGHSVQFEPDLHMPIDDADFTTGLINPETGTEYPSLSSSVRKTNASAAAASAACKVQTPSVFNMVPGKLLVYICPTTLAFTLIKADVVASEMFNFDADAENINMMSLFGFATDHARVHELQQVIMRRQIHPMNCYINLYTSGSSSSSQCKRPIPVHLTLTPVLPQQAAGLSNDAPRMAVLSVLDAGSVGWLKMQATGFAF